MQRHPKWDWVLWIVIAEVGVLFSILEYALGEREHLVLGSMETPWRRSLPFLTERSAGFQRIYVMLGSQVTNFGKRKTAAKPPNCSRMNGITPL